ncbi:hypothetical protein D3C72_2487910 [compost metagenome]
MKVRADQSSGKGISSIVGVSHATPSVPKYAGRAPKVRRVAIRWRNFQLQKPSAMSARVSPSCCSSMFACGSA